MSNLQWEFIMTGRWGPFVDKFFGPARGVRIFWVPCLFATNDVNSYWFLSGVINDSFCVWSCASPFLWQHFRCLVPVGPCNGGKCNCFEMGAQDRLLWLFRIWIGAELWNSVWFAGTIRSTSNSFLIGDYVSLKTVNILINHPQAVVIPLLKMLLNLAFMFR